VCLVGTNVGCVVGFEVGDTVGDSVGDTVGDSVGDTVGDAVGDSVGVAVGDSVGDTVGDSDEKHCQKSMESTVTVWGVPPFSSVHEVQIDEIAIPSSNGVS